MDSTILAEHRAEIKRLAEANRRIAIHACLEEIYEQAMSAKPKLIVELGVSREALANKVLEVVAKIFNSDFISCDIHDFGDICTYAKWIFVHSDDVAFSRRFSDFCIARWINPMINLLLIDTDEVYDHVCMEIENWFPFLSEKCAVMLRCTNLQKTLFYQNGSRTDLGWDNQRGVIRAIQDRLNIIFDETREYQGIQGIWHIKHVPWGAGLTTLRRMET